MPSITGTVFISDANAAPETDVILRACDIELFNKQLLGEVTLQAPFRNTSQTFQIRYSSRRYQSEEGANIQVQASTLDGLLAGETQILFNAPDEVSNIRIELHPVENPASEYERLVASLKPLMEGVAPAELTSDQIVFLARDAEAQRSRIFAWNEAAILSRDTDLPVEAGYGWFRRLGNPHTLAGLLAQEPSALRDLLLRSIGRNIIPDITDQIDTILADLERLRPRVVFGTLTFDSSIVTPIESNIVVQAYDRDLRSEELLGEDRVAGPFGQPGSTAFGRYRIEYLEAQYQRSEGYTADIVVRAHTEDGRFGAESATFFNAGQEQRIDLALGVIEDSTPTERALSELEDLQERLDPLRENVAYRDFTDEDLVFLVQEVVSQPDSRVERVTVEARLGFLRTAAQFEDITAIPLAAFYGWFRQTLPTDLDALLDTSVARLQRALETAIRENIIPDISAQIPEILDAIRSARLEQGRLINHRFVIQLINSENNRPLANIQADVIDLDTEPDDQNSERMDADGQGVLVLNFVLPGDAPAASARRLQLTLRDEDQVLARVEVAAVADQTEVVQISVTIEPTAEEQRSIDEIVDPVLAARLNDLGITSVAGLLDHPELIDEEDDELVRVRDHAKIAVLNPDLTEDQQRYVLDNGLASPQAVAKIGRAEFVSRYSEGLGGDAAAYTFYKANQDLVKVMHHQIAGNWLEVVTSPGDDDEPSDIPGGVSEIIEAQTNNCGCEDCTSAVSPAAYLAYLLDWMLTHIKYQGATVAFADFVNEFHQPFAGLPTHCDAVTREVRQVRLVVESLWRYIDRLNETDLQMPTPFCIAYRRRRNQLYKMIVANLGVSFGQLRRATLPIEGKGLTAEQVADQRTAVANILGVDESVVPELFFNVDDPDINPTEELLEATFGYENTRKQDRFATRSRPRLISWQREKLESQWQIQDWAADDYSSTNRLPYIDPALIDETYLRKPLDTNPAFSLLTERQTLLANHRQGMVESTSTDLAGLEALLESELSQSIDQLQAWFNALQGEGDESAVADAPEAVDALHLTPAGFSHLMATRSTLANDTPLGDTADEIQAVWNSVFDILSRAHRHQQFAVWVEQENDGGIVFGPKLFWPSVEPPAINPWLAGEREQAAWLAALDHRNLPPIIDPDQIPQAWVLTLRVVKDIQASEEEQNADNSFTAGIGRLAVETSLDAFELWERRRSFVDERINDLHTVRQGAATPLDALGGMLTASKTGLILETLVALREQEAAGQDIAPRLAQLNIERSAYRFLTEVHILAEADTLIPADIWEGVEAILVQVEKQRAFAEWRNQEQEAQVSLHPNHFQILSPPDKVADNVRSEWLHTPRTLNRWVATLEARKDQFEALETALTNAVSAAESQMLTQLRDLLISDSAAPGESLQEKAEWLDKRLLMDMFMDGCHMTTRVSQAIETLQRLVRGVYNQEHDGTLLDGFALDAVEDYETEWPVMGTYATWKAYLLAYLFPENLLHLSPPARQSHGLNKLYKALPGRINEQQACELATEYSSYFYDICNLEVQATCQLESVYIKPDKCDPTSTLYDSFTHIFARSSVSGMVYWAYRLSNDYPSDNISTWIPLGKLGEVDFILGAAPHETPSGQKLLLLFAGTTTDILMRKFDVSEGRWLSVTKLDWPQGYEVGINAGTIIQKRQMNDEIDSIYRFPTLVSVTVNNNSTFIQYLSHGADSWRDDEWAPLYGPSLFDDINDINSLIQIDNSRYAILAYIKNGLHYQVQDVENHITDHYEWRKTNTGLPRGGVTAPTEQNTIYCFTRKRNFSATVDDSTEYQKITFATPESDTISFDDIEDFNDWLVSHTGVSIDDESLYEFNHYVPDFFIPNDVEVFPGIHPEGWNPFSKEDISTYLTSWHGDPYYTGSLLGLITRDVSDFSPGKFYLEEAEFDDDLPTDRYFYLFQQKFYGVENFIDWLGNLENVSYSHPTLGWWKFVNDRMKILSIKGLSLAQIVKQLLINKLHEEYSIFAPPDSQSKPVQFYKSQSGSDQLSSRRELSSRDLTLQQNTFYANSEIVFSAQEKRKEYNFPIQGLFKFSDGSLSIRKRRRIAPYGGGSFNLLPEREIEALQRKRLDIKVIYRPLRNAPASVQSYLHEAYLHVPVALGYMLQKSGNYEQALIWYRQVYDYLQSSGRRKIYHYLKIEQQLPLDFEQVDEYLDDSTSPHVIARTRKNTYTRHILLLIIRCLIDYADALFARDNVTDNARARELYTQALKFLDFKVLKPKESACENILRELEVAIDGAGQLPLQQFESVIAEIPDPDRLRTTGDNLRAIGWDTNSDVDSRIDAMRAAISSGLSSVRAEAAELPPAKLLSTLVEQDKLQVYAALETQYLANSTPRSQFRKTNQQRKQTQLSALASITDTSQDSIPWLRQARPAEKTDDKLSLAVLEPEVVSRLTVLDQIRQAAPLQSLVVQQFRSFAINTGVSFSFCIPQNPVISALRRRAENNLTKLRTCRNIAGFLRQIDPYGAPITIGSGMVSADGSIFSGVVDAPPTPYRYAALIARAKELVTIAQQIEGGYQSALEAAEREALSVMQAEQNVEIAGARVVLQDLRVNQANSQLGLANLQKGSAELRVDTFQSWIDAGPNRHENNLLMAYREAGEAQESAAIARATGQALSAAVQAIPDKFGANLHPGQYVKAGLLAGVAASAIAEGNYNVQAIQAQAKAQTSSAFASFERRQNEWQLQQGLAAQDILIGDQQIQLARDGIAITQQERAIAGLEQTHAASILQFLLSKTFTEEMYRWIASVLEDVYRYFLQEAASIAHLAERQIAFERQQGALKFIQSGYWNVPLDDSSQSDNTDRLGITGSARLLKDIYQLDQYAFETRQRKEVLSVTIDLAEYFPFEFQQFRETGIMVFSTPQSLIDQQFPGNYLCLVQQVSVSVVALISPTYGIRGVLTSAGISKTVVGGDTFQTVTLRHLPERLALTSPVTSSGQVLELQPDAQGLQNPFEGMGFASQWELKMPKANNVFDYNTIATVLFTIDFTALHSYDYEQQVIEQLDRSVSANRTFRFRYEFADAWYDLNNPDRTDTPMRVRFETRHEDFPPNMDGLRIQHILLYFIRKDGETFEVPVHQLLFMETGTQGSVGGSAQTVDGVISTRRGNSTSWLPMIGKSPFGEWELAFADAQADVLRIRDLFTEELIEDILFIITYEGTKPAHP
ncbi:hypothetical protein DO021_03335 [Desulfobacter hydrogenophilus]|uniref:Uncharacterized protein n=1 Tax=Desulfobacter hydrogenophilus TaxID=2291 RepID=A0A328FGL6_9BACT|nr:neuraminidase-like domain-containing protein [Desulfobacter hydrogenophilus]NDY70684.1 hypothetical protein [Desulfobacter hydrogenophilus]QBH12697.1 hypothetical protein EYB58_07130 [Desulfobacter hydrogenophilus]RAM03336.1 hypothetical protein DO021_03335 [Desulfobacter hydrogenophilus]